MGLQFKDLIVKKEIAIDDLRGKTLAVDAMNLLYQFLATIRGPDGALFTDAQGRVTSHLIGLFNRTTALMEQGLKLAFVFDGKPPEIKQRTWEKRTTIKEEAFLKLKEAEERGDIPGMRKFASRTSILTREMREDAQAVITALGLPIVQAPSEGEAQASFMVAQGDCYAAVSQDYDTLIFGCPLLVRNLSIEGRRKKAGTLAYETVKPELISLKEVLQHLGLTQEQLIVLAMLVGTDYNPGGIKGIGPKTGLKLVKEYGRQQGKSGNVEKLFAEVKWGEHHPDLSWKEVFDTIKHMPVSKEYELKWKSIDEKKLYHLLVEEHGFGAERVRGKIEKFLAVQEQQVQKGLKGFF